MTLKNDTIMTTVEQKIKSIVDKIEGATYIFDDWATANHRLNRMPLPAVVNVLPASGVFHIGNTQLKDYPNCMLAFIDKAEIDKDGTENDQVVERCKNMAREFLLLLNQSRLFAPVSGNIPYSVIYDRLDVNVTGVVIELRLEELKGLVLCYGKSVKETVYGRSE